jgi:hypothetical protein
MHLRHVVPSKERNDRGAVGWAVYQCTSCENVVCFKGTFPEGGSSVSAERRFGSKEHWADLMMPERSEDFTDWPERAKCYMEQALEAMGAPDGAVMLAGSAVDAMLKQKGFDKGPVYERIEKAVKTNLLTEAMGEWAHAVRLSANNPRHADIDDPHATTEEAQAVIDFAKALGQFLFVLPARVQRGKEAADRAKENATG